MKAHTRQNWFHRFLSTLIDYLPVIVTVIAAVAATLAAIRQTISVDEMLQWILTVLALLATTLMVDRLRVIRGIESELEKIRGDIDAPKGADALFTQRMPDLEDRLKQARTIAINGITLSRTSDTMWPVFRDCVKGGGSVRLLVIDPDHVAVELAARRFHKTQNAEPIRREARHALDNFESLLSQPGATGQLEVKLAQFVPICGIWLIDVDTPRAEIWVEVYTYRATPEPTFHLLPGRDGDWFDNFRTQFENMWIDAKVWSP